MFAVINKENEEIYHVYDVAYDKTGYPHFLVYENGQWVRMSAKHFAPVDWISPIGDVALRG